MSINWAGAAAGYQGAKEEQRRLDDDERRADADARAKQEATFADEQRGRVRSEWAESDRIKTADKADIAAVREQFAHPAAENGTADLEQAQQQVDAEQTQSQIDRASAAPGDGVADRVATAAAPGAMAKDPSAPAWLNSSPKAAPQNATSPKLDPEVAAKVQAIARPAGMPKALDFNQSLAMQTELIRRKVARGDMTPEDYTQKMGVINKMKNEGINDALALMGQGRYDDAMERYNQSGAMSGARVVKGVQGSTKINGEDVPTHFVTVRNGDGSTTTMDVALAQYQLLDISQRLTHGDRATQLKMQRDQNASSLQLARDQMAQQARDHAASRGIQRDQLALTRQHYDAGTPFGQLQAKEKALGRPLGADERASMLGVDTLPVATRAQLNSLLKEQESISQSLTKAQAEGNWTPESPGSKQLSVRSAVLNQQVADLLGSVKRSGAGADPLNLNGPAPSRGPVAAPAAGARAASPASTNPVQQPAGVRAPAVPAVSPVATALGMSGDKTMNQIVLQHAAGIEAAAQVFKDEQARWLLIVKAGDPAQNAAAQQRLEQARAAVDAATERAGVTDKAAVLAAAGL